MGFRFYNLNPNYKALFSKTLSHTHPNSTLNRSIQAISFHSPDPSLIFSVKPNCLMYRRSHMGGSHHHHNGSGKEGENIFRLGLAADIGLATGKALTGYLSGSTAIIADAAHSVSDVVLSGVALWSFKAARAPKDNEHPYGHGKFETLGALGISCMLLATAGGIGWHALDLLMGLFTAATEIVNQPLAHGHVNSHHHGGHHHGIDMEHPILALNMTIVSISIKEGLYWITKRAGERVGSGLMKANAWHHRADAISSVVALIGVGGSILGVKFLDPLAGLVVSGMILKAGLETGYHSVMELVDAAVPLQQLDPIKQTILKVEGVKGCHRLRARKAGSYLYLDVHIEVDPFSSVSAAHDVGENVRHQIHKSYPEVAEVFIHIDPSISHLPAGTKDGLDNLKGTGYQNRNVCSEQKVIEEVVFNIFLSNFSEKMVVEHITHHSLQGKILLQIEVSMPLNTLIGDATKVADEAKKEILKAALNVPQVSILLRLGHPLPQFQQMSDRGESPNIHS